MYNFIFRCLFLALFYEIIRQIILFNIFKNLVQIMMIQAQAPTIIHHPHLLHPQTHQFPTQMRKKIQNYSFCLTDKIGKGFSSVVYKGKNDLTNQTVAIKVIQLQSLRDQITRSLLQAQLECIRKLNHPNLLKCFDSYKTVNNCYIITQYCQGGDLEKKLRQKGKFTQGQLINFFAQFYSGYQSFLSAGYIHRDLKPANIFLKGDQIKIADFGMIKKLSENPRDNYNVGTPVYMPPESLFSNIYSQKSDVWSIGVICYQLTHGTLPWKGNTQNQLKLNIQNNRVFYDYSLISMDLIKFIDKCLEKSSYNRVSISQMLFHPWMVKNIAPLLEKGINNNVMKSLNGQINNLNLNSNPNPNPNHRQGSFHFINQRNITLVPSVRNSSNPKPSSVTIHNFSSAQLISIPSLQILQNKPNNQITNGTYKQPKSQRLTMDSDAAMPQMRNKRKSNLQSNKQNQNGNLSNNQSGVLTDNKLRLPMKSVKKSPLQYLISILNYLRYLYKIYKIIQGANCIYLSQTVKNSLSSLIIKQLIKCLSNQEKVIKNKQNVYGLSPISWEQFIKSKKWMTYVNVVEQYSIKYRKIYDEYIEKKGNILNHHNEQQNKRRISQPLQNIILNLQKTIAHVTPLSEKSNQISQVFKIMEILDYLVTIYNLEQLIFCYGWLIFVQKSPINQIVQVKCQINGQNYKEVWQKLQNKIKIMFKL